MHITRFRFSMLPTWRYLIGHIQDLIKSWLHTIRPPSPPSRWKAKTLLFLKSKKKKKIIYYLFFLFLSLTRTHYHITTTTTIAFYLIQIRENKRKLEESEGKFINRNEFWANLFTLVFFFFIIIQERERERE